MSRHFGKAPQRLLCPWADISKRAHHPLRCGMCAVFDLDPALISDALVPFGNMRRKTERGLVG